MSWTTSVGAEDTATSGQDFESASGTVYLDSGAWYADINVPLIYDGMEESAETFSIALTSATNGITIVLAEGLVTIHDAIEVPDEEAPPDCQCGAQVGRTLTGLSSDKGAEFWEGDAVAFSTTLSAGDPPASESFVWEWRPLRLITRSGERVYGNPVWQWNSLPGAGTGSSASYTFSEPFIGQIRVTLTSAHTVTHRIIEVRAKAAIPEDFGVTSSGIGGPTGDELLVFYAWSSSSTRLPDLDGVSMDEFVWVTDEGYQNGRAGKPPIEFRFPKPPFNNFLVDGYFDPFATASTSGAVVDRHGNIRLSGEAAKTQSHDQYYRYKIGDAFHYWQETEGDVFSSKIVGDPYGEQRFRDMVISYTVGQASPGDWRLTITKKHGGVTEGSGQITIPSFPWP